MKRIIITLGLLPLLGVSQNQITYKIEKDDPTELPWISTNLDLFSLDVPINNSDATSFYMGLWGYVKPVKALPLKIDYSLKRSYLVMGAIGNTEFPKTWIVSAGGRFDLFKSNKMKNTKIVLKSTSGTTRTSRGNQVDVTKNTLVTVSGKRHRVTAARGGFYYKSRGYNQDDIEAIDFSSKMTTAGFYGGVMLSSYKNIFIKTDKYGTKGSSKGLDLYVDAIFAGTNFTRISDGGDVNELMKKNLEKRAPVGLRLGLQTYEIEQKLYTDKFFGMNYNFEVGILPYEGIYFQGGVTLTLLKVK